DQGLLPDRGGDRSGEPRQAHRTATGKAASTDQRVLQGDRRPVEPAVSGVIAVLGFGEAGSLLARDLVAAGARVRGYDPAVPAPAGVTGAGSDAEAASGADLVLSVNSAKEAEAALRASLDALSPGAAWADLNTAS